MIYIDFNSNVQIKSSDFRNKPMTSQNNFNDADCYCFTFLCIVIIIASKFTRFLNG